MEPNQELSGVYHYPGCQGLKTAFSTCFPPSDNPVTVWVRMDYGYYDECDGKWNVK
jgi:hypothetical protein